MKSKFKDLLRFVLIALSFRSRCSQSKSRLQMNVYYASQVWLNETLTSDLWQKLKALHYRVLRATQRDFKRKIPKATLDWVCKRATPKMLSSYITASLVIKIFRDRTPINIHDQITGNLYSERRKPNRGRFYNNSRGKIGLHELRNRLTFKVSYAHSHRQSSKVPV